MLYLLLLEFHLLSLGFSLHEVGLECAQAVSLASVSLSTGKASFSVLSLSLSPKSLQHLAYPPQYGEWCGGDGCCVLHCDSPFSVSSEYSLQSRYSHMLSYLLFNLLMQFSSKVASLAAVCRH